MDKKEAAKKMEKVIEPCTEEFKKNTKKYNEIKNNK